MRILHKTALVFCLFLAINPINAQIDKFDRELIELLADGQEQDVLIIFQNTNELLQGNITGSKEEKATYVYELLKAHAIQTQSKVIQLLEDRDMDYRSFSVANALMTSANEALLLEIAALPEVTRIQADQWVKIDLPTDKEGIAAETRGLDAIEWGISMINADQVWDLGYKGEGITVGGQDTGVEWDHPAIKEQYRGWTGTQADHNYNWHDAIHEIDEFNNGQNPCGLDIDIPCDDNNHGTHTIGTMVGDVDTKQIGVAPEASWVGCRNMERGWGRPGTYLECFEWFLAPTDSNDENPDPTKAPHVINNSWGCPEIEGCNPNNFIILETAVNNLKYAGTVVVASAGNSGNSCESVSAPPAIFANSFSVGATNENDNITGFSSRGPVTVDGSNRIKPDVSAPGRNVYSCITGGEYASFSGTSMAGPHVAGAVALIISARPELAGQVDIIEEILEQTAVEKVAEQDCGGVSGSAIPNNTYGYGRIDVLAAVNMALDYDLVSTQNLDLSNTKVYPNPAFDEINIQLPDNQTGGFFELHQLDGTVLMNQELSNKTSVISIKGFNSGLYIYTIRVGTTTKSGKLSIIHP